MGFRDAALTTPEKITIDFVEALPRHATGKLYKQLLKDQYWSADANSP